MHYFKQEFIGEDFFDEEKKFVPRRGGNRLYHSYPLLGGILPGPMRPFTIHSLKSELIRLLEEAFEDVAFIEAIRVQLYNISARTAESVFREESKLSHKTNNYIILDNNNQPQYKAKKHIDNLLSFYDNLSNYLDDITEKGSPARAEIAFSFDANDKDYSFKANCSKAVHSLLLYLLKSTFSYDFVPWAKVIKFYMLGVIERVRLYQVARSDKRLTDADSDILTAYMPTLLMDTNDVISMFYSGKGTFVQNSSKFAPCCAYAAGRAIMPPFVDIITKFRDLALVEKLAGPDTWYTRFLSYIRADYKGVTIPPSITLPIREIKIISAPAEYWGLACSHCYKMFRYDQQVGFQQHFCLPILDGEDRPVPRLIDIKGKEFEDHVQMLIKRLTPQQIHFLLESLIERNVLLLGVAGSGKSFIVRVFLKVLALRYGILAFQTIALTKLAALQVDGMTLFKFISGPAYVDNGRDENDESNTFCGLNIMSISAQSRYEELHTSKDITIRQHYQYLKHALHFLIIDECGIIGADLFEYMDLFFRLVKGNMTVPFGGLVVKLVGDFLQNAPMKDSKSDSKPDPKPDPKLASPFPRQIFQSHTFSLGKFLIHYLSKSIRQAPDTSFLQLLNRGRYGSDKDEGFRNDDCVYFNEYCGRKMVSKSSAKLVLDILVDLYMKESRVNFQKPWAARTYWCNRRVPALHIFPTPTQTEIDYPHHIASDRVEKWKKDCYKHFDGLPEPKADEDDICTDMPFVLCTQNVEVDAINEGFVEHIINKNINKPNFITKVYDMKITNDGKTITEEEKKKYQKEIFKAAEQKHNGLLRTLTVFKGMEVMFTSNSTHPCLSNNLTGVVHHFDDNFVYVNANLPDGIVTPPVKVQRIKLKVRVNARNGYGQKEFEIEQFPLRPGYAANHIKSQGLTIYRATILNIQRLSADHCGATYALLSRVPTSDYIFSLFPIDTRDLCAAPVALRFDLRYRNKVKNGTCVWEVDQYYTELNQAEDIEKLTNEQINTMLMPLVVNEKGQSLYRQDVSMQGKPVHLHPTDAHAYQALCDSRMSEQVI